MKELISSGSSSLSLTAARNDNIAFSKGSLNILQSGQSFFGSPLITAGRQLLICIGTYCTAMRSFSLRVDLRSSLFSSATFRVSKSMLAMLGREL